MTKTEELVKILTAYRFIALLLALLVAIMGHYEIAIDSEVADMITKFFASFIGVNTAGKGLEIFKQYVEALKEKNTPMVDGEV